MNNRLSAILGGGAGISRKPGWCFIKHRMAGATSGLSTRFSALLDKPAVAPNPAALLDKPAVAVNPALED
ncbi:MAG: hypothetical protein GX594_04255 [Pirellulaceae bacterium]|nr:hypothetical protein [Pirellulaceae bacterium]